MPAFGIDITKDGVRIFEPGTTKHDALDALVEAITSTGAVTDIEAFRQAVHEREAVMSTGIGSGVAIPHVRIDAVAQPTMGIGISASGMAFDTLDDEPVHIVFMFAMPSGAHKEYLKLLSKVMQAVKSTGFQDQLLACTNGEAVLDVLNEYDA